MFVHGACLSISIYPGRPPVMHCRTPSMPKAVPLPDSAANVRFLSFRWKRTQPVASARGHGSQNGLTLRWRDFIGMCPSCGTCSLLFDPSRSTTSAETETHEITMTLTLTLTLTVLLLLLLRSLPLLLFVLLSLLLLLVILCGLKSLVRIRPCAMVPLVYSGGMIVRKLSHYKRLAAESYVME